MPHTAPPYGFGNLRRLAALCLLLPALPAEAQSLVMGEGYRVNYRGNLSSTQAYFPREAPDPIQPDFMTTLAAGLDLNLQTPVGLEFKAEGRTGVDLWDRGRVRALQVDDLFMDWFTPSFELRGGWQVFSWKTVESVSNADFLNTMDFQEDFFNPRKIGTPALRIRGKFRKERFLEAYYLPWLQPARLPTSGNRYDLFPNFAPGLSNEDEAIRYHGFAQEYYPQIAIRYQFRALDFLDMAAFFFDGYNNFPSIAYGPAGPIQVYHHVHKEGVTFQGNLGSWLLKGEATFTRFMRTVRAPSGRKVPPYLAYTTGFEYTFNSLLGSKHDLGTIAEIIGDTDTGKDPLDLEGFRPYRNNLVSGLRYVFNNTSDRTLLFLFSGDYRAGDAAYRLEYDERLFQRLKLTLSFDGLDAGTHSAMQGFEHTLHFKGRLGFFF